MPQFRVPVILALFSFAFLLPACSGVSDNNVNGRPASSPKNIVESNSANTNAEELGVLVKLPYETEDCKWKDFPAQKRLVAVLRFSPADSAKIVADAEKNHAAENVSIQCETWFIEDLIAQCDMSGNDLLRGFSYSANQFLQEPYTDGRLTRIEGTDYFVLEATAK